MAPPDALLVYAFLWIVFGLVALIAVGYPLWRWFERRKLGPILLKRELRTCGVPVKSIPPACLAALYATCENLALSTADAKRTPPDDEMDGALRDVAVLVSLYWYRQAATIAQVREILDQHVKPPASPVSPPAVANT